MVARREKEVITDLLQITMGPDAIYDADTFASLGVNVIGERGSGKTNTFVVLAENMFRLHMPGVVLDVKGDMVSMIDVIPNGKIITDSGQITAKEIISDGKQAIFDLRNWQSVDEGGSRNGAAGLAFAQLLMSMISYAQSIPFDDLVPVQIFVDEGQYWCPQKPKDSPLFTTSLQTIIAMRSALMAVKNQARAYGLTANVATQNFSLIHKDCLTGGINFYMHQSQAKDIKGYIGELNKMGQKDLYSIISDLPVGAAIVKIPGKPQAIIKINERISINVSRTPKVRAAFERFAPKNERSSTKSKIYMLPKVKDTDDVSSPRTTAHKNAVKQTRRDDQPREANGIVQLWMLKPETLEITPEAFVEPTTEPLPILEQLIEVESPEIESELAPVSVPEEIITRSEEDDDVNDEELKQVNINEIPTLSKKDVPVQMRSSVDMFFDDAGCYENPSYEVAMQLARLGKAGNQQAKDELINCHLRLCGSIAVYYVRRFNDWQHLDEAVSEATEGIMRAWKKYDPERGFTFTTYAFWWIRRYVVKYFNTKIQAQPTEDISDLADHLYHDQDNYIKVIKNLDDKARVAALMDAAELNPYQIEVIKSRYGIDREDPLSFKAIGETGSRRVKKQRVYQVHEQAKKRLLRANEELHVVATS